MANITLKVDPEKLVGQAGEITELISGIERDYDGLKNLVDISKNYWIGDAGDAHRSYAKDIDSDMKSTLKRLKEHPDDLLKMADLYQKGEKDVLDIATALPIDIIK